MMELEYKLCMLAGEWRLLQKTHPDGYTERLQEIVKEYHQLIEELFNLQLDSELDVECLLPKKFMPERYMEKWGDFWFGRGNTIWGFPDKT